MADVNRGNRPLSPHLQIYRTHILMVSSILIRISGNGLTVGIVLVLWWLLAAFALGLMLFIITLGLNLIALRTVRKYRERY